MSAKCQKCGATIWDGVYLERVNEKGIAGIYECRPACGADLPQDTLLVMAIEGDDAKEKP